eukprot:7444666-Heterocapsa_arctica.AAC.1
MSNKHRTEGGHGKNNIKRRHRALAKEHKEDRENSSKHDENKLKETGCHMDVFRRHQYDDIRRSYKHNRAKVE